MNWTLFLIVLALCESDGRMDAVGDIHMTNKAYGCLQIRQPYLDDANRIAGTSYTMDQVRNSRALSKWCAVTYLRHYGAHYERVTGNQASYEVLARIHNGGPSGWRKTSTEGYWKRYQRKAREHARRNQ